MDKGEEGCLGPTRGDSARVPRSYNMYHCRKVWSINQSIRQYNYTSEHKKTCVRLPEQSTAQQS